MQSRAALIVLLPLLALAAGCGGGSSGVTDPDPPVGHAVLPDLTPAPPKNVRMSVVKGHWFLAFDSIMVNVGQGDFVLRAKREGGRWDVVQDIQYSTSGAKPVPIRERLVWGGDGHEHWHIARVAATRLVPLTESAASSPRGGRIDSKVGFCFFDHTHPLRDLGPKKKVFSRYSCGHKDDDQIRMGLSPGWADTYPWTLPGQRVDVSGLHDGLYRLWAKVDERRVFREATRSNNLTWVDVKLWTRGKYRFAQVVETGPRPHRTASAH